MQKLFLSLIFCFMPWMHILAQDCSNIVSNIDFEQMVRQISTRPNDEGKIAVSKNFLNGHCFTSQQILQLASLFNGDAFRLQFAKDAYSNTFDRKNYYDVTDAFKSFSAAFRLYHFIDNHQGHVQPDPELPANHVFPPLNYPDCINYKGIKGCQFPVSDYDFDRMIQPVIKPADDNAKMNACRNLSKNNCMSMAQLMKIATTIELETNRLIFLKDNFLKIYDLENYQNAAEVFSSPPYVSDWQAFAAGQLTVFLNQHPAPCEIKPQEFEQVKNTIDKESNSNTKLILAKQIISSKKCFRSEQLKEIVMLMPFESGRLELAKYAYDFCTDRGNYYLVNDAFSFSSSKNELMNFVNEHKK